MLPIGPLMIEHRLIERMISLMAKERDRMEASKKADPSFIDTVVDFIRTYATLLSWKRRKHTFQGIKEKRFIC